MTVRNPPLRQDGAVDAMIAAYRASPEARAAAKLLRQHDQASFAGLHGAAVAFFLASVLDSRDGPHLVVTATQEEAEELREELEAFSAAPCLFFPPWESLFGETSTPDDDIFHDRLRVLKALALQSDRTPDFVVAPVHAVLQPVPGVDELTNSILRIAVGAGLARDTLAGKLADAQFRHVALVIRRGEFSVRGDIVDLFPFDAVSPIRIEYFADVVESVREYSVETQRSLADRKIEELEILVTPIGSMFRQASGEREGTIIDMFPEAGRTVLVEPMVVEERLETIAQNLLGDDGAVLAEVFLERLESRRCIRTYTLALAVGESDRGMQVQFGTVERFRAQELDTVFGRVEAERVSGTAFTIYCDSAAERHRVEQILADSGIESGEFDFRIGPVRRGFESHAVGHAVLATVELFNRHAVRRTRKLPTETKVVHGFFDLQEGDLVVHVGHGVGRYLGVRQLDSNGLVQEFLIIEFRYGVKVHVPASKIDLVQKYVGSGKRPPALDRVGGSSWSKRKTSVEEAIVDFASELLEVQAVRREKPGLAYPEDDEWQRQFESAFPFEDTPDQRQVTDSVKSDLRASRPMDRLLCGDVGYGKTEIAMRAAFKVVMAGRQVVVLVPTTVLAQQHCRTFRERMAGFPICIEQLSRFCTGREQKKTVTAAREGQVDILIGTHRILSDDVGFRDLGMVVIDEEQRFGVGHKEKLKRMRATVDILTLTATPIPRTLHMSLLGIRDISSLSTPPEGRSPIQTQVIEFDRNTIREAILRELNREGQVYFVHNRVKGIGVVRHQLQQIVPEAVIEYAHGQMTEHHLEDIMIRFLDREIDLLLSTTIIETGIDIPNVNTIFVDECDRFGLAALHQLRGRVGRSRHRAYCYLVLPERRHVNPEAQRRIQSIQEFSQLGAGFQIAMRDLEIRGAGNILGAQQSGHIAVIGYDLYCRLLEKAVKRHRGEIVEKAVDVTIGLALEAYIPESMITEASTRLEMYRKISTTQDPAALEEIVEEIRDRYGAPGREIRNLIDLQLLRIQAARRGLRTLNYDEDSIILGYSSTLQPLLDACPLRVVVLDPGRVAIVVNDPTRRRRRVELTDQNVFRTILEWLRSGEFPRCGLQRS